MNDKPNGRPRRPRKSRDDIPPATAEHVDAGVEFLDGVLERMGVTVTVKGDIDGTRARFELDGDDKGLVNAGLGQGSGAVPQALETLVSMSLGRLEGGRPSVRVGVAGVEPPARDSADRPKDRERPRDSERPDRERRPPRDADADQGRARGPERPRDAERSGGRDRPRDRDRERPRERSRTAKQKIEREAQLGDVAQFLGQRIAEIGVPVVIMGMDSFDRRIIHHKLGDQGGMETASEGFGSFRRLKIRSVE